MVLQERSIRGAGEECNRMDICSKKCAQYVWFGNMSLLKELKELLDMFYM